MHHRVTINLTTFGLEPLITKLPTIVMISVTSRSLSLVGVVSRSCMRVSPWCAALVTVAATLDGCRPCVRAFAKHAFSSVESEGEGCLEIVTRVCAEGDVGLRRKHSGDLVHAVSNHLRNLLVFTDSYEGDQVDLAGYRVDLAHSLQGGNGFRDLGDASHICPDENDGGDHEGTLTGWPMSRGGQPLFVERDQGQA